MNKVGAQLQMENQEIRDRARAGHIALWQIALKLGVSEPTITRWLRTPLSEAKRQIINDAISELLGGKQA